MNSRQSFSDFADNLSFYGSAPHGAGSKSGDFGLISLGPSNPAADCSAPQKSGSNSSVQGFIGKVFTGTKASAQGSRSEGTSYGSQWAPRGTMDSGAKGARHNGLSGKAGSAVQEEQGLLASGMSAVKDGASRILGTAQSVVSATTQSVTEAPMSTQHLLVFGLIAGVGVIFLFLAFLTLPLLVFAPSKFALLFTLGSVCLMVSLAFLRGITALVTHLSEPAR